MAAAAATSGPGQRRVGFVGAGRMAEAIAQGLIRAGGTRRAWATWDLRVRGLVGFSDRPAVRGTSLPTAVHLPRGMNLESPWARSEGSKGPLQWRPLGGTGPGGTLLP